jgi:hypothetical protein
VIAIAFALLAGLALAATSGPAVRATGARRHSECFARRATIVGTVRGETLVGTRGRDVIAAGGGRDSVRGRGGRDLVCGGRGRDRLFAGRGADRAHGGPGDDRVVTVDSIAGNDLAHGGAGTGDSCRYDHKLHGSRSDRFTGACEVLVAVGRNAP